MESLAIILILIGIALLGVEIFIPGFGIFGILGIIATLLAAIVTALYIPYGIFIVLISGAALILAFAILSKFFKNRQLYSRLVLTDTLSMDPNEFDSMDYFLGKEGITVTPLKPYGSVDFNGVKAEVFSAGPYIPKGRHVKVIQVNKNKIIVEEIKQ